tara:strand:+ start:382 stop:789 length:408 start_codon:yes stop_codon:yes gene_type:complete
MSTKIEKKKQSNPPIVVEAIGYATACLNLQIPISERVRVDYESVANAENGADIEASNVIMERLSEALYEALNWFGAQHYWEKETGIETQNELFDNCEVFDIFVDDWCVSSQQLRPTFEDEIEARQIRMKLQMGAA